MLGQVPTGAEENCKFACFECNNQANLKMGYLMQTCENKRRENYYYYKKLGDPCPARLAECNYNICKDLANQQVAADYTNCVLNNTVGCAFLNVACPLTYNPKFPGWKSDCVATCISCKYTGTCETPPGVPETCAAVECA